MSQGEAFLQAILADPDDDAPRLIYADWLEERGDPRGAFIRLQCALERLSLTDPARPDLEDEADELLYQHEEEWTAPLQNVASAWRFRRGFVEEAAVTGDELLARGDALFNSSPVVALRTKMNRGQVGAVAASPHLARLRTLDVESCQLRDRGVEELLASPHLTRVTALNLAGNDLEGPAVRMLVDSPMMARLTSLRLNHNGSLGVSAARRLAQSPASGALRTLDVSSTNVGPGGLRDLLNSPFFVALTSFSAGHIGLHSMTDALAAEVIRSPVLSRLNTLDFGGFRPGSVTELLRAPALGRLKSLSLSAASLEREAVRLLAESLCFSGLTVLDLGQNAIGPEGLVWLAKTQHFSSLKVLRLGGNGVRDAGLKALAASPYITCLVELELSKNGIGGPGVQAIAGSANFAGLATLDLSENYIGLESVRTMTASPHLIRLTCLNLRNNRLDGEAARLLSASPHWRRLSALNLDDNALGDGGLYALLSSTQLARLCELSVRNNGIGSAGAERLAAMLADAPRFARLRKLDLRGNPLGDNERRYLRQRFGSRIELD